MDETASWKQGKSYHHHLVKTFHRKKGPKDGTAWYARVSEHDKEDATFEEFWNKLGLNKAENEMQYVFFGSLVRGTSTNTPCSGMSLRFRKSSLSNTSPRTNLCGRCFTVSRRRSRLVCLLSCKLRG